MEEQDYRTTYELEERNWWFAGMRTVSLRLLGDPGGLRAGADGREPRVLDVGCGTGIMLDHLAPYGRPTGLDFSATALDFCRKRGAEQLVQGRGEQLPFADGSFDAVTAFGVVEHIDADQLAVAEWARVLRPGGRLVLLTSAYQFLWSGHDVSNHHTRRYLARDVERLLSRTGLVPDKVSYLNTAMFPGILAVRVVERLRRGRRPPEPKKDTGEVPDRLNRVLTRVLELEGRAVERARLPFGVSIIARATKPVAARPVPVGSAVGSTGAGGGGSGGVGAGGGAGGASGA